MMETIKKAYEDGYTHVGGVELQIIDDNRDDLNSLKKGSVCIGSPCQFNNPNQRGTGVFRLKMGTMAFLIRI